MLSVHSQVMLVAPCWRITVTTCRHAAIQVAGEVCVQPQLYQLPLASGAEAQDDRMPEGPDLPGIRAQVGVVLAAWRWRPCCHGLSFQLDQRFSAVLQERVREPGREWLIPAGVSQHDVGLPAHSIPEGRHLLIRQLFTWLEDTGEVFLAWPGRAAWRLV